jgi:hypothetical protein
MPQRPDGQAARPQRVTFTKGSAERIAAVVRDYEAGDRAEAPLRFGVVSSDSRKTFRVATFTGAWAISATKTVTFKYQTSTPNTASVVNLFFPYPASTDATDCAIAREGTAWHLIDVPFQTATAVFSGGITTQTVVSNVVVAAVLNTSNCQITVTRTNTTAAVTIAQSTFTSVFVRFGG